MNTIEDRIFGMAPFYFFRKNPLGMISWYWNDFMVKEWNHGLRLEWIHGNENEYVGINIKLQYGLVKPQNIKIMANLIPMLGWARPRLGKS